MKLVLGTVQFGLQYGISNTHGIPTDSELSAIFETAQTNGITTLDTALAYGNSEERLGQWNKGRFKIITKFPKVNTEAELKQMFQQSLNNLNSTFVEGYMAHNADNLIEKPFLWSVLQTLKQEKKNQKIGYSLYTVEQLNTLLDLGCVPDIVQLPYSLLDRKFETSIKQLHALGTEIHIRSVFLQGLYWMNPNQLPQKLMPLQTTLQDLQKICEQYQVDKGALALNFVHQNPNVDAVVIGVENQEQLVQNIRMIKDWKSNDELMDKIQQIKITDVSLLNPANW
mgnify:FL=1